MPRTGSWIAGPRTFVGGGLLVATTLLLVQLAWEMGTGPNALRAPLLPRAAAPGFATFGEPQQQNGTATVTVVPVVTEFADGSTSTVYELPDGSVMTTVTPPPGFAPLEATAEELARYNFPARPSDRAELRDWKTAMAAYRSNEPPGEPLEVAVDPDAAGFATYYSNWAGYIVGDLDAQSHMYVAVKANLKVPTNSGTCGSSNLVGFWIGLGGTAHSNDLVQQGIECGSLAVGPGSAYRPFTEFANTAPPVAFCGYSSWTLAPGDVIYQNMSFQTSQNKAFFYMEDQTSGVAHSCSRTPPSGWAWDLNTAEWIAEAPAGVAVNFGSVRFSNARAQLSSNGNWVTLASQTESKTIQGYSSSWYCIAPGTISAAGDAFTDSWHSPGDCYPW
jgi:hypothetical protein